jgi:hypothetical protein
MAGPSIFGSILSGAMDGLAVVSRNIANNISQEREAVEVFALRANKAVKVSEKALFSNAYRHHKRELSQYLMYEFLCGGAHQILSEFSRGSAPRKSETPARVELIAESATAAESATEMDRILDAEVDSLLQEIEDIAPLEAPLLAYRSQIELPQQLAKLVVIAVGGRIITKNWQTTHC